MGSAQVSQRWHDADQRVRQAAQMRPARPEVAARQTAQALGSIVARILTPVMSDAIPRKSDPAREAVPGAPQPQAVQSYLRRVSRQPAAPWLHAEVARRMAERLAWIKRRPLRVIDWWSAGGGSLDTLGAALPAQARIDAIEPIAALRERSAAALRAPWWSPRRWRGRAGEARLEADAPRDGSAELLWSNMALHWAGDPAEVFVRWRAALAVEGFVMFSCFGPDTLRELRALHLQHGFGPASHSFIDMHDLGDALVRAGFAEPVMDMETIVLHWADAASMRAELRGLGSNAAQMRPVGLRTPRWRGRWDAACLQALAGADDRPRLSFEIIYGHAFVAPPRLAVAAETRVGVEELRRMARAGGVGRGSSS
jgi:malonyl-CoA O-methyltransferase